MTLLKELPIALSQTILRDWLELSAIARLDSAACNNTRSGMLDILNTAVYSAIGTASSYSVPLLNWLITREIKVSEFRYDARDAELVSQYLQKFGQGVKSIQRSLTSNLNVNIGDMCPNLNSYSGNWEVFDTLTTARHLQELRLTSLPHQKNRFVIHTPLPNLRLFSCTCANESVPTFVKDVITIAADSLRQVQLQGWSMAAVWPALCGCAKLRSLGLVSVQVTDAILAEITDRIPHLYHLDLQYSLMLTDAGILHMAQNLRGLRSLNLANIILLTDLSLQHLTEHCAITLEVLYLHIFNDQFTAPAIAALRKGCTALHTFRCCSQLIFIQRPSTYTTLLKIDQLASKSALSNLSDLTQLEILDLSTCQNFEHITTKGLSTLAKNCPVLRTVVVDDAHVELCMKLTKKIPSLTVTTEDSKFKYELLDMLV